MQLILSGGGPAENVVPLDQLFADAIDKEKPVLYIPVAWENDPTYAGCFQWFTTTYRTYGITFVEMCTDLNLAPNLDQFAAIFIGGGNTFKLLKEIKESGFDQKLLAYLQNGGFVYGGSAGAMIFGKSIQSAGYLDANHVALADLSGLNLADGRDIFCHYAPKDQPFIDTYPDDLYILYEESGLYITHNKIESIGKPYLNKVTHPDAGGTPC